MLHRVDADDAWSNLVLPGEIDRAGLAPREAALATEITYGTLRMLGTLDWAIATVSSRPIAALDAPVRDALRLGAYQLLYTNVPVHAAVAETVRAFRGRHGVEFVNAVLRRLAAGRDDLPWPQAEGDRVRHISITRGHPEWLVSLWAADLGPERTAALCTANNQFPGVGVRAHGVDAAALLSELRSAGLDATAGRWSPDAILVRSGGRVASWSGYDRGAFAVADEASVLAASAVEAGPDDVVVDLAAGPGGKTGQLAARRPRVVAVEPHAHRARLIRGTLERLDERRVAVVRADGTRPPVRPGVDAVLVDAPCTGLGVLRRRPEARWRVRPGAIESNAALQTRLVIAAFDLLRIGGTLVYAVCTVTKPETTHVVAALAAARPDAVAEAVHPSIPRSDDEGPALQLAPDVHGTDGMFIARFRRTSA